MRKQKRPPEPDVLKNNAATWNQEWVAKLAKTPGASFSWHQREGISVRDRFLPLLREMNQGHCSFCDGYPMEGSSKEPVEHFKPKNGDGFPEEAFTWGNLYYACEYCQSSKLQDWDDKLLRPDSNDYSCARYFDFDSTNGVMRANPAAEAPDQDRASTTIRLYGLDDPVRQRRRREELRKWQRSTEKEIDLWPYRDFLELA